MPISLARRFHLDELRWDHSAALAFAVFGNALVLILLAVPRGDFDPYIPATPRETVVVPEIEKVPVARQQAVPDLPVPPERPVPPDPVPVVQQAPVVEQSVNPIPFTEAVVEGPRVAIETPIGPTGPAQAGPTGAAGYLINPDPPYPSLAKRRGWEGTVMLRVLVGADGRPREVRVLRSSGHSILDTSAQDQVLNRWRFQPATRDGVAIEGWVEFPVAFRIQRL